MKLNPSNYYCSGSVRLGLFLLIVVAAMLWMGGQGLYTALHNRQPTVISYAEYVKTKPKTEWISLTNCVLDLSDASYRSVAGSSTPLELFVPVHGPDEESGKVHVLLATKSPEMMQTLKEMQGLKSEQEATAWALKNQERVFMQRTISGLVRFGIDMKEKERSKLSSLQANLASDFIILDDGKSPSLGKSLGLVVGGVMVLGLGFMFIRRNREVSATDV